jgi:hypothetical protein
VLPSDTLIGKRTLIGLTYIAPDGSERLDSLFGTITALNDDSDVFDGKVIIVECHDGVVRHYPWTDDILEVAEPGFYELKNGATIEDPEFEMHWTVHEAVKK